MSDGCYVVQLFALLLGTDELLTSFDAINLLNPDIDEAPAGGWLHVDQSPLTPHLACLQGLVNLAPVGPDTSGGPMLHPQCSDDHPRIQALALNLHSCCGHSQGLTIPLGGSHSGYSMPALHAGCLQGMCPAAAAALDNFSAHAFPGPPCIAQGLRLAVLAQARCW